MSYRDRHPDMFQEEDAVPPRGVLAFIAMVFTISAVLVAWTLAEVQHGYRAHRPSGLFPERFLGPRHLVARVRQDLFEEQDPRASLGASKRRELRSFGWVDRGRGLVRIPITEAMDLVAGGKRP